MTRRTWMALVLVVRAATLCAESPDPEDRRAVTAVIRSQERCWNHGDLVCYMAGYQRSEDLLFIGKSGLSRGWQQTLERYRKSYPDREAMGTLTLEILEMERLAGDVMLVIGRWQLRRTAGEALEGHFSLVWKKIEGEWVIIADHSS